MSGGHLCGTKWGCGGMSNSGSSGRRMSGGPGIDGRSYNGGADSSGGLNGAEVRAEGAGGWRGCNTGQDGGDGGGCGGRVGSRLCNGGIAAGLAAHALELRYRAVTFEHLHTTEHGAVSMTTLACGGENRELRLGAASGKHNEEVCVYVSDCSNISLYMTDCATITICYIDISLCVHVVYT